MLEAILDFQHILETIRCFGTGLPFHALHLCDNSSFIGGIFFRNRHHTYDLEYTFFVAFSECICWDSLESVTTFWFVLTLSSIHFFAQWGGELKKTCLFAYLFCRAYPVFFPVSFFYIISISFLFRIKFHHFSVPDRTITRCLGKFSFVFPSVSPVAVACFCTKLFGICTKQNIFCIKTGGNSGMFFQAFRDFFIHTPDFFGGVPRLFE